jgi:hypothetical protein
MVDPITARGADHFTVNVFPNGQLDIACDPIDRSLAIAGDGCPASICPKALRQSASGRSWHS